MFKRFTASNVVLTLIVSLLVSISFSTPASATACDNGASLQNNISVTPSQGKAFYIDSGQNQNIDASYVGYQVRSVSARQGVTVKLDNFTGGVVTLANSLDSEYILDPFTGGDTKTAFFLLKAPGASSAAQTHRVSVYNGRPEPANLLYQCNYTFTRVQETIKANPNKVDKVEVSAVPGLGATMTVQVYGSTGTIGAGKLPDYDAMWVTPAAQSSFPSRSMRLERVEILYDDNNINNTPSCGSGNRCFSNQLLVDDLRDVAIAIGGANQKTLNYWIRYTFRVLSAAPAFTFKPISQISSGTQMKHTPMSSFDTGQAANSINLSSISYAGIAVTKVVNTTTSTTLGTTGSGNTTKFLVPYRITAVNTGSSVISLDQVVDKPDVAVDIDSTLVPTVEYFSSTSGGVATSTVSLSLPGKNAAGELIFSGPFSIPVNGRIEIDYRALIPQCPTGSGTQSYANSAFAKVGSTTVGAATAGFTRVASVETSCSNTTSVTSIPTPTDVRIAPEPITNPATSIANTSATINGTADSNGVSGLTISYEWGTTSSLGNTAAASPGLTTTSTNPLAASANLVGLTSGTLYYYRIKVGDVFGEIMTFATTQPVAAATVTTDAPSNISSSNASLNATVDPNLTPVFVDLLVWRTNDTVTVRITDDPSIALNNSTNPRVEFSGAFPTAISVNMTDHGLSAWIAPGATIFYRARTENVTGGSLTLAADTRQFTMTTYIAQEITFGAISNIIYGAAAPTITPSSNSGMTLTYGSETPLVCTISSSGVITILKAGTCTITTDQDGGLRDGSSPPEYFEPAEQRVQSFEVTTVAVTITADAKSKSFGVSDPTLTAQVTSGSLVGSDTLTGTLTRAAGESIGAYQINRGTFGPGSNYNVTYVSALLTISATTITVTAAAKTKQFGANDPALTFSHTPALSGSDTFTGTLTRSAGNNVGQYSILIGSLALPAGYQIAYVGETLTVTARPLTITADSKSKNAGDSTPTFTSQNGVLVSPNAISGVTHTFSGGGYGPSTTPPTSDGTYTITPSAAQFSNGSDSNYNITYETGTYTITSLQSQTLTWTTIGNKTYGTSPTGTVISSQALTPVTVVSLTTSICTVPSSSASGATITLLTVGVCELKASQPGNGTTIGPATDRIETFTVLAAPLVITASSPTGIRVGDAVPTITPSYSGFVNSQTSSVLTAQPVCITSYTTSSAVGTSETTSCSGASAVNYTISYVAGSFVVAAAPGNNNNSQNPAPAPVQIVRQAPTVNWSNPSPITVGTPLSGTQLNALFSVPGTCVYSPALGTVLPEGSHTLSVTCTPTDLVNFLPITTTVTIQVRPAKMKATIFWFNPAPINNPTPLGATQLNAVGSVPGDLTYTPAAGTVLEPGSYVLTVRLKPNDPDIDELETRVTLLVRTRPVTPSANPGNANNPNRPTTPTTPGAATPSTPTTPGNSNPAGPAVRDPQSPQRPLQLPDAVAIATPKGAPVLQTAGRSDEVVTVKPNAENTGYIVAAEDWSLAISSTTKFVQGTTVDSTARVTIEKGNTVTTSGIGFKPFSQVDVYVYSTPIWLGAVLTDQFGNFTTTLPMPPALPEGDHTFQAQGLTPDDRQRTAAVPITLIPATTAGKPGELRFDVFFAMNSTVITKAERAKITRQVKGAQTRAETSAKFTITVIGWVQPNRNPGNIKFLSTNRAKNVANLMKRLGLPGNYSLSYPGLDKNDIPTARRASVVIKWNLSK